MQEKKRKTTIDLFSVILTSVCFFLNIYIFHLLMATSVFHSDENQVGGYTFQHCLKVLNCAHTQLTHLMGFLQNASCTLVSYDIGWSATEFASDRHLKENSKGKEIFRTTTRMLG